jgi:hypothetical protein
MAPMNRARRRQRSKVFSLLLSNSVKYGFSVDVDDMAHPVE